MKIALIGEFSNVHWTLAENFRSKGHKVTVISTGDGWKNYQRDVDILFQNKYQLASFFIKSIINGQFKGYDIVQLINYKFIFSGKYLGFTKKIFLYLKKYNNKIVLGAFGDDYFYVKACMNGYFRYSPFDTLHIPNSYAHNVLQENYTSIHEDVNRFIADNSDVIIACAYDYYTAYKNEYYDKVKFIPLPIDVANIKLTPNVVREKIKIFVGVQKNRSSWKGTDIILQELNKIVSDKNSPFELKIAIDLSYKEYINIYNDSNIFFDQLYSYSTGMNGLLAMAKGKIVFGGAEPESYQILGEYDLKPIINISPFNIHNLSRLLYSLVEGFDFLQQGLIARQYIEKHHSASKVADSYLKVYSDIL